MFALAGPLRLIAFAARQHHIDRNFIAKLNAKEKFTLDLALSINDFKQIDQIVQNALNSSSLFGRDQNAKFSEFQAVALNFSNKINDFPNHTSPKEVNHLWMMLFGKNTLLLEKKVESGIQKIEFQDVDYDENPTVEKEKKDDFPPSISQNGAINSTEPSLPPSLGSDIPPPPLPSAPPLPLPNQSIPPQPFNTPLLLPPPIPKAPLPGNHEKLDLLSQLKEKRKKLNLEEAEVKEGEGTATKKITPKSHSRGRRIEDLYLDQGKKIEEVLGRWRSSMKDTIRPPKLNRNETTDDKGKKIENPNIFDSLRNQVVNKGRKEPEDSSEEEDNEDWK